jgi:ubiquinone/menaquinone biosynthesis C-methylase UbiE/intracellular sulfur oxidation DsrE/DsrF family protein
MRILLRFIAVAAVAFGLHQSVDAQEQSVRPGINDSFKDPNVEEFEGRFEVESREVYLLREQIVEACKIKPGETVADIGAGTGLFTRLFSDAAGKDGRVIAVDISQKFLDHIADASRQAGQENVETLLCKADSTELPANSVDMAFICDTYHHFEFPQKTLASLFRAVKPGGRVVLIDFRRVEGESTDWVLQHVRAGQEVFVAEIEEAGFNKARDEQELLKENYFVEFTKPETAPPSSGRRGGRGPGAGVRADQQVFHYLLENHQEIRRTVTQLDAGVETLTESDNPQVAAKIQEHVASMHRRVKEGRGLRFWDELFAAIFANHASITMEVVNTEKGVRVKETSDDPTVARLIQAHASVVSLFVTSGFDEAHKNHPLPAAANTNKSALAFSIIRDYGGVAVRPNAVEPPLRGAKVVFDVSVATEPSELNKGLVRVARLLNLYGAAGLSANDITIAVVLHGESTKSVLSDGAFQSRLSAEANPNLPLINALRKAGVEVLVCGQALNYQGFADSEVADGVSIATAALTVVVNRQSAGYAYVPVH